MPMPSYPVLCYTPTCGKHAEFKLAARWSDGVTSELKTYGLACEDCLAVWFRRACERHAACRKTPGETLDAPGIYRMEHGERDQKLDRVVEMEESLSRKRP